MSLAPRQYFSTDAGAPQLTGTAGSLIAVLDAVLVNGYGSQQSLGWTKPFSGTNLAAYRNSPTFGTGRFLRLNDTNAQVGLFRGFENMTDINTGTGQFPTTAQQSTDTIISKSVTASAVVRPWYIIGNARCFYLFINIDVEGALQINPVAWFFGDFNSYRAGDTGTFVIPFGTTTSTVPSTSTSVTRFFQSMFTTTSPFEQLTSNTSWTMYASRHANGFNQPMPLSMGVLGYVSQTVVGTGSPTYPLGGANALPLSRCLVKEEPYQGMLRGELPGVYAPMCNCLNIPNMSLLSNLSDLPVGTQLRHVRFATSNSGVGSSGQGSVFFDVTNNW